MAYHRIGTVQGNPSVPNLGDREGAVSSFQKAIALLASMADRSTDAAIELTRTQFSLVATLSALGRSAEALTAAREAQVTAERLIAREATDARARRLLGSAYFWHATISPTGTGPGQSIPLWSKARDVFESLLADAPDDADRQRNVALVAKYLGEQYRKVGDLDQALAQHRRALELDAQRVAQVADDRQAQLDLALDWSSLGGVYREMGRLSEAAEPLERSLAVRARLAASDPTDDYLRGRLAHAHALLGNVYGDLGRVSEALGHLRDAVQLSASRPPADVQGRVELFQSLVTLAGIEQQAGRAPEACARLAQAERIRPTGEATLPAYEKSRMEWLDRRVADGLASCGVLAPGR
jgi:non-specific serine/threonine protein kinase/serine/threonine-protein kinase